MSELLDAALEYATRGWRVLPLHHPRTDGTCSCGKGEECSSPAKHPRTKNGLKDATTDEATIRQWWSDWPAANIGLATGADSGFVVLDVDPGHGGEDTLLTHEEHHGPLPTDCRALTGGEGWHYLFQHPGERIRNNAGTKLGPGLDVRGDGGYIVAAPSRHISENRYEWLTLVAADTELPTLPDWLLDRLRDDPEPERRPLPARPRPAGTANGTRYGHEALDRECADIARAVEGTRNHTLNRAAYNLGQLVAGGELDERTVIDGLTTAGLAAGLLAGEVEATIGSGLRSGKAEPRTAPPPKATTRPAGPPPPTDADAPWGTSSTPSAPVDVDDHDEPPAPPPPDDDDHDGPGDGAPGSFDDTDLGNARRLVNAHGAEIRYVPQWKEWLVWTGCRWERDITGHVERKAKGVAESILLEAIAEDDHDNRKRRTKFAFDSQRRVRIEAMIALARTEPGVPIEPHQLDADPWMLNVRNGTIDLRTGELRDHDRTQHITKLAPVDYDPAATLDTWDRFLDEAVAGADGQPVFDVWSFLQRAVGYSLTGSTAEEVLFFVHGPTKSGKSTFLDALESTLGDYAKRSDFETFLARQQVGGIRSDIARLAGARFVNSVEVDDGAKLAEGLVKTVTGGDVVTARFLYKDEFEFRPQFKLWLAANHAPRVKHSDHAMWRRIVRIPFENTVPEDRRDPQVKATLRDPERGGPAILAWAVQGCLAWQREGLAVPDVIAKAGDEYRASQDPLRAFLDDRCILDLEDHEHKYVSTELLRRAYTDWARDNGVRATLSTQLFAQELEERGVKKERRRINGKSARIWTGIALRDDTAIEPPGGYIDEPPEPDQGELL